MNSNLQKVILGLNLLLFYFILGYFKKKKILFRNLINKFLNIPFTLSTKLTTLLLFKFKLKKVF